MVGILPSYWGGLFSGATLVSGRVFFLSPGMPVRMVNMPWPMPSIIEAGGCFDGHMWICIRTLRGRCETLKKNTKKKSGILNTWFHMFTMFNRNFQPFSVFYVYFSLHIRIFTIFKRKYELTHEIGGLSSQ